MATLGKTNVGANGTSWAPDFDGVAGPWTASENGTITSVSLYTGLSGRTIALGIYEDTGSGEPGALIDSGTGTTLAGDWTTINLSGSLVNGTDYWIGLNVQSGVGDTDIFYADQAGKKLTFKARTYDGTLLDPWVVSGASNATSREYSAYITYTPAASDTITCTDQTAGRIYQRAAGTAAKTVSFAGTYTGTTPTTVEVRIVNQSGGATIQDWTALGSPTIAGGNWSGTISVPEGTGSVWYNFLARSKDGGAAVLATSAQTSNKWGVGVLVGCGGQSNMGNMFDVSSTPPASHDLTRQYNRTAWGVVPGNGAIQFANLLRTALDLPIGLLQFHAGGTAITDPTHEGQLSEALNETGDDCEYVIWHQGESDAIAGTSKATYKTALDDLYTLARTETGRTTSQLKFGVALLGNISNATPTDATTDAIRQAQLEWINETTGAFFAGSSVDMVRTDDYHWTAPYYERMGRRYAQAILFLLSEVAFGADGPVVASALRNSGSADIEITVTHDGGTAIEELDGTTDGGSLTGWEVSDDDFATTLTISSTAFVAGKIVLTLSAVPADVDTIKVRYQYGENPNITNPVYDDTVPQSDTIGLPLQPTIGSVTASLIGGSVPVPYYYQSLLQGVGR